MMHVPLVRSKESNETIPGLEARSGDVLECITRSGDVLAYSEIIVSTDLESQR